MLRSFLLMMLVLVAAPVAAQDDESFHFGDDAFLAGRNVSHRNAAVDDLFAAGHSVSVRAEVSGSAHLAGRFVTVSAPVGDALYAVGMDVDVAAPVMGDALLAGDQVTVTAGIGGDLRVMGSRVVISAPVGDAVLIAGETVLIDEAMAGDVSITANTVEFGDAAVIEGTLHLYHSDPDSIEVPESVVPADRITLHKVEEWQGVTAGADAPGWSFGSWMRGLIGGVLTVTVLATILAAIAPEALGKMRERGLESPFRALWMGALALSAVIGSVFVFAATGIGLLLVPVSLIAAVVLLLAGYIIGVYVLGVGVMGAGGRDLPSSLGDKALAALVGAVVAAIIALVPIIGWLAVMALTLAGGGALVIRVLAPGFHTEVR